MSDSQDETMETVAAALDLDVDAVKAFRKRALNPDHPEIRGTAETRTFTSSTQKPATNTTKLCLIS